MVRNNGGTGTYIESEKLNMYPVVQKPENWPNKRTQNAKYISELHNDQERVITKHYVS